MRDVEGRVKSARDSAQDNHSSGRTRSLLDIVSIGPLDEDVSLQVEEVQGRTSRSHDSSGSSRTAISPLIPAPIK